MNKLIFLLVLLIFNAGSSQQLSKSEKLFATCKVWGFLKYYHPRVANGEFNWDNKLFEILPKIEKTNTKEEFSLIIEDWINNLGEIKEIAPIVQPEDIEHFDKNFDLSWIQKNKLFSKGLRKKLKFIENNRFQGNLHYLGGGTTTNIFIKNENYSEYKYTEEKHKIVALFGYWNIIEYFFPYKYMMDKKWDKTLQEMLPLFIEAKSEDDFYLAMKQLTVRLNDTHAIFHKYAKKRYFLPIVCKIIDEKMIVTEILNNDLTKINDIKVGDIITKVNDKTIKEIILENRSLIGGSNEASYLYNVIEPVLSGYSENIKLEFLINGKNFNKLVNWVDYTSNRYELKGKEKKEKFKMLENNIGYVNMGAITEKNVPEMIDKLKSSKGIVFDLRNYPNNTYSIISNFLNTKEEEFAVYIHPDLTYPGRFKWLEGSKSGFENKDNYKGKVVVLVNEESVSQSEWTAMCFQTADNTTIIGSQTGGADGNVTELSYIKAFMTRFSAVGVFYPDKKETQRIGIIPDIEIKPTIRGIQQGKDEVLERAIQFIETGK
jgi:C-terminal processing protease CtpA/Prc